MSAIINWLAMAFDSLPLPLLEVWGRLAYIIGFALAISAFGGFTFRPGGRWGFGRERQAWDAKAVLSIPVTFVLIIATGYIGSFIVLVPGAQTFESLKDLMVFLCIVLFGYPALIAVPFAYGISDLIEGVPPGFLLDWLPGYFINPACFWIAYQLFGKNPDFRRAKTWGLYLPFVVAFMSTEPFLWGYICADKFTSPISYGNITPALFFTTAITWIMAPFAMLAALPLARKSGMFWAEIPGHVKERLLASREWVWQAGSSPVSGEAVTTPQGWPIRIVLLAPFIGLVLLMVGVTAYVTLRSAANDAHKLATRLHAEISDNINLQLDEYLAEKPNPDDASDAGEIKALLDSLPIAKHGVALIIGRSGHIVASSAKEDDPVAAKAVIQLRETSPSTAQLKEGIEFRFDHVTEKPLSREVWLAHATAYEDRRGGHADWTVLTLMPESFYLAGVQTGNSRSAMVFAVALLLALAVAAILAAMVANPLRRISLATQALAHGDLNQHAPGSRMEELNALARSFNNMAERLKKSFDNLNSEIELRKRADQELHASEQLLRHFIKHTPAAVAMFDTEMRYLQASDRWIADYHLEGREVIGRSHYEVFPDTSERWKEVHRRALLGQSERCDEDMFLRADGSVEWLQWEVRPWHATENVIGGVIFFTQVITERKQAEEKLRETESSRRALIDAVQDSLFLMTPDGKLTIVNDAFARRLGRTVDGLIGISTYDLAPAPVAAQRRGFVQKVLEAGQPLTVEDRRGEIELESRIYPAKDATGKITHIAVFSQDITERKRAEVRLREQATLLDQAGDAILVTDLDNRITYWNRSAERLFGWKAAEAVGLRPEELFTDFPLEQAAEYRKSFAEHGRWTGEVALRPRTGEPLNMDFRVTRALDTAGGPRGRMLVGTDVTEKKKIQEQFLRAQRLESIGMLAAGITHDLNNVLAPIGIISDELRPKLAGDKSADLLDILDDCARRGAGLIDQILGFARGVGGEAALVQAGQLLHDVEQMTRKTFPKSITITSEVPNDLWLITCSPTQIHQILLNLCVNARDAMPDGGTLTLRAENRELDVDAAKAIEGARAGNWLVLHVADTGIGIQVETLAHIWEPFFTTKPRDKGTGLGLPTVRGIVETHKGFITLDTAPGRGTTFRVYLPAT